MKNKSKKAMSDDLVMMCEYLPKSMMFKTKSERLVCAVMMFYANKNKDNGFEFSIPMVEIAKITCISKYTVCNAVKKLVDYGVFDIVRKGNSVSKKATLYRLNQTVKPNSRVVDSQVVTDKTKQLGNCSFESDAKPNSNQTIKPNSRVVESQGVTDDIELFGNTDGVEHKLDPKFKYKYNYKKNDNKRNDMIGDVNNVSFERLLNVLERLVVSVDDMNRNIDELKTIVSQQGRSIDCLISRFENINNRTAYSDNNTISTTEKTDGTVAPRSSFDIISSSPVATGIDIQQQPTFITSTDVSIDDINDAKASLRSRNRSSIQDRITSLWVEIERGSDFESAYSELQGMFNAKVVTQRQWELTQRKYEKRKSSTSLDPIQKKEKEKKVGDTPNKTLMYFPKEKMNEFNDKVMKPYNACKTALYQERNDGKAFDDEKYIKVFNAYAQNFMELSNDTDEYGNRLGNYQYLNSKVWMNPFTDKCNDDTKAICERYKSIQAKKQAVVNA